MTKNVFEPITFRKIELLGQTAARIEGVRRVISLAGIKKAVDVSGDWSMEKFYAVVSKAELFQRPGVGGNRSGNGYTPQRPKNFS